MAGNRLNTIIEASEGMPFGFALVKKEDGVYHLLDTNGKLPRMLGYGSRDELLKATGGLPRNLLDAGDYERVVSEVERELADMREGCRHMRYRMISKSGEKIECVDTGTLVHDEELGDVLVLFVSRFDEKANASIYDEESGLHSRAYLLGAMEKLRAGAATGSGDSGQAPSYTVVYVQIERFHDFNDALGHEQGNLLLKDVGALLSEVFRTDLMARLYADQFAVVYAGDAVRERCEELLRRATGLRDAFPIRLGAGIYCSHDASIAPAREIDRAKLAYDSAVRAGKGPIGVFSKDVARERRLDAHIIEGLDEAIENGYLSAAFQPVVRTVTQDVSSFEALARWSDPDYGSISPGRFIPLLEERRLAHKVDEFMALQACKLLRDRLDRGLPVVPISVNLSRTDFERFDPVGIVRSACERYRIEPRLIAIEITETVVMENPRAVQDAIVRFHELGHEVWMDDFGSAYSSLNALRNFAFDEIKIDMAFMSNLDVKTRSIVGSIVNMAKKLGMRTLAEGVENETQASFLRSIGCNRIQGYLYGRPLAAEDASEWVLLTHTRLETREESALHDEAGMAVLDPHESQALLFDDGKRFSALFASAPMARALGVSERTAALQSIDLLSNGTVSSFGPMLRHAAETAAASGEEKSFYTTIGTGRYESTVRTVADNGSARIQFLDFDVVADSGSSNDESRREMLVRSIADCFDAVYLVDPAKHQVEVVHSSIAGEHAGMVMHESNLKAYDFVHPDDRLRFLRCFDTPFVAKMLDESATGSFSVLIRVLRKSGEYRWREFSFLRVGVGGFGSYLVCARPYPLVGEDVEQVARAILASRGDAEIEPLSHVSGGSATPAMPDSPFPYVEATVIRDEDGTAVDFVYLRVSASYARRVRREPDELVGKRYLAEFPNGSPDWPAQFARAIDSGKQAHSIIYGIASGSWMECYIAPLPGRDRVGIVFVSPDNVRTLTDQELFSSYQDMPLPCLVVRPATIQGREDSEYVYMNDEYCRLVGKRRSELVGHGYRELFSVATTEWVDLVRRAARGERLHERIWGGAQHHWMDVRFAPSSVLGCAVVVGIPIDEEHDRISELTTRQTTDVAAIDIARRLMIAENYDSAIDSAIYLLGKTLGARRSCLCEFAADGPVVRFAHVDLSSPSLAAPQEILRSPERFEDWEASLSEGMLVVSDNVPLEREGRYKRVTLPRGGAWSRAENLMIAPIRENGQLVGMLAALNFEVGGEVDAVSLFETVAPFFQARFVENRALSRAEYDSLTGVRSRGALEVALSAIDEGTAGVGIAFADVNDLKATNDGSGHAAGDDLLKRAAGLLCNVFDVRNVYRVGGDEFVAMLVDVDERRFQDFQKTLLARLGREDQETFSVGFAWTPNANEADALIKVADERMYREKGVYHDDRR